MFVFLLEYCMVEQKTIEMFDMKQKKTCKVGIGLYHKTLLDFIFSLLTLA